MNSLGFDNPIVLFFFVQGLIIVSFLIFSRRVKDLFFLLPVVSIVTDMFGFAVTVGAPTAIFRGVFFLFCYVICFFWLKRLRLDRALKVLIVLVTYWFLLVLISSNIPNSFRIYAAVIISLVSYPFAKALITDLNHLKRFHNFLFLVLVLFVAYPIISNIFKIGSDQYFRSSEFAQSAGSILRVGWQDAQLYTAPFALMMAPVIIGMNGKRTMPKWQAVVFILTIAVCILSLRRTAMLAIVLGYSVFYILDGRILKLSKIGISLAVVLAIGYLAFQKQIDERIALRSNKFSSEYNVTEENRFVETVLLFRDIGRYDNFAEILFGKELFNSRGNYGDGALESRVLHIDFNVILHGSGYFGIILYLLFYLFLGQEIFQIFRKMTLRNLHKVAPLRALRNALPALFIMSLVVGFSGQMASVTFRLVTFMMIGSYLSVLQHSILFYDRQKETTLDR
jgi:hypothetical protein